MRRLAGLLPALALPLAPVLPGACCGSGSPSSPSDAGGDLGAALSDLVVTVAVVRDGSAATPGAAFAVRAENGAGGAVEATTDAAGVAHLSLDLTAGPYDVTAARGGFSAFSVVGVTTASPLTMTSSPTAVTLLLLHTISGSIAGKASAADVVVVDGPDLVAGQTAMATYAETFTSGTPFGALPFTAIEVDATGALVNGAIVPGFTRGLADIKGANITLPSLAPAVTTATLMLHLPATGVLVGGPSTTVVSPGPPAAGNTTILLRDATRPFAETGTTVGVGTLDPPTDGLVAWHVQSFSGPLAPSLGVAVLHVAGLDARILPRTLADGRTIEVGAVDTLAVSGASLGDVAVTEVATGYDALGFRADGAGAVPAVEWVCVAAPGATIAARGFPRLPTSVSLADLGVEAQSVLVQAFVARAATAGVSAGDPAYLPEVLVEAAPLPVKNAGR